MVLRALVTAVQCNAGKVNDFGFSIAKLRMCHGNMELINDEDATFAKVQQLFHHFQILDSITSFGGIPGNAQLYGFKAEDKNGVICTVVNPSATNSNIANAC